MLLEIHSWQGGRQSIVRPVSARWDGTLRAAYHDMRVTKCHRDEWLDWFDASAAARANAKAATSPGLAGGSWVQFRASAKDFEVALADEQRLQYQGVLEKRGVK